jgi:ABC-type branched-subunit amino acid transport system ATPase component
MWRKKIVVPDEFDIEVEKLAINKGHIPIIEPTSLRIKQSDLMLIVGETEVSQVSFALSLAGRMKLSFGSVKIDNEENPELLQEMVVLVDVPNISEPDDVMKLETIVGEELAIAGQKAMPKHVRAFLQQNKISKYAKETFETLPNKIRYDVLMKLASIRPNTKVLLLAEPDRLGGKPEIWWKIAKKYNKLGFTVVVQCRESSARILGEEYFRLGENNNKKSTKKVGKR